MAELHTAFSQASAFFKGLQDRICTALEEFDGKARFGDESWRREGGGGGRSRIMADGAVFEKAGVNFSDVNGQLAEEFARQIPGEGTAFAATGISLVLHPLSPMIPTVHANWRYLTKGSREWFGGGSDLTPYYPYREDVIHFHQTWKRVCDHHNQVVDYHRLKSACDEYFYLPHRSEARGVGGIFFDYLEGDWEGRFAFVKESGEAFLGSYLPIAERRREEPYSNRQRAFQLYRRGRYVEFNLLYDRGTIFGLKTGARVESVLMSLPPLARWPSEFVPEPGSREAELLDYLKPRDWAQS
jgi:coproporphyrinogen III oxidase